MFTTPEQFATVAKANLEAQLAAFTTLSTKSVEAFEQIVGLNINASKASLEEYAAATRQLLAAKDPQEFVTLTAAQAQPVAARAIAYGRQLASIANSAQTELTRVAEEQFAENSRKVTAMVDDAAKNAPAGSENVIAIVKSAIGNANAGYEQFSKATKQAAEVVEANINNAVSQFSQAAEKTASAAGTARTRK
ncbi:TIGR01841 family phasin [Noviherbaspirillum galbum]|uniref:TIGR01841 family phasin n=1 Tax=Noviherbaspirillum galbum TaxID=2709383 RepID=A0A6B3STB3_9BURK|nr:TIGR01841 family phasin [Noviherbaspirillum galbum]NEX60859.1 TIGR01841 family phasin [Noviherbaspirillum galbum]